VPHTFTISTDVRVISVLGLMPPRRDPKAHVFRWTTDGTKRPAYFRWCWHPATGDMVVGVVHNHICLIHKYKARPFKSWLRGFVFCSERQIAARSYFWPSDPYDDPNAEHAKLDAQILAAFAGAVRPHVRGFRFKHPVDDTWLLKTYGKYSRQW